MNASWALQQAVYARLEANDTVRETAGVYDAVPRGADFPYIVVGEAQEAAWDTATETGSEHTLVIRIWSRAGGQREAKYLAQAVRQTLDGADLTLDGHTLVGLGFVSAAFDRRGEDVRAVLRFRAVTEKT